MATMRAVRSGAAANPSRSAHVPPDPPISDETESEAGVLEHFERTYTHTLGLCSVVHSCLLCRSAQEEEGPSC